MKTKYLVQVDRGFRGVPPGGTGEFDDADPEVKKEIELGFLQPAAEESSAPAEAAKSAKKKEG